MLHCFYRISDNGYKKNKLPNATKIQCLTNFLTHFLIQFPINSVTVFVDGIGEEVSTFIYHHEKFGLKVENIEGGSSAGSWRVVCERALELPDNDFVLFQEDDYLHLPGSYQALIEALERGFPYVTLYDAPDKYIPANYGGNPYIDEDGADATKVYLTKSRHWRITNSTTMTFACRVRTLREDMPIWEKWTSGTHPHDFQTFLELREKGRFVVSPIPSLSTHCEIGWLAPLIDWSQI
jgi:hypothetical protein